MSETCNESSCSSCSVEGCSSRKAADMKEPANQYSHIKHVIGVVSGKGGVGKSLVTSELAVKLHRQGYKVGVLDADITGPSIPKVFGIHEKAVGNDKGVFPAQTPEGIKIISVNLMLDNEEDPVIWRGPVIAGVVKQFWNEVIWGDLDYLLVDMPPGTGDVPLTVFQSLPVDGVIIVTSPQELVEMIVKKAYNMAKMMNVPVLGLVQNMSYLLCPDCGRMIYIYGEGKGEQTAKELSIPSYASLPIDPSIADLCDAGRIEEFDHPYLDAMVKYLSSLN